MNRLATVICAAGFSSRFGSPKLLSLYKGETLLKRAVRLCHQVGIAVPAVITGIHHDAYLPELLDETILLWRHPSPEQGFSSTLALGIAHWKQQDQTKDALLVILPDMIFSAETLSALIEAYQQDPSLPAVCRYPHCLSPPSIIPSKMWPAVSLLSGDCGAQALLKSAGTRFIDCSSYLDIDTVEQLALARVDV